MADTRGWYGGGSSFGSWGFILFLILILLFFGGIW
jgi:hypothetical protein